MKNFSEISVVRKSVGSVKINGKWLDEVAKEMLGFKVVAVKTRDGVWHAISSVEVRA